MRRFVFIAAAVAAFGVIAKAQDRENPTPSPDSSLLAFTCGGNLFVEDLASKSVRQLTYDGSELIHSGYASWVYYEEIFGRPSKYKAFWWSPDSRRAATTARPTTPSGSNI